MEENVNKLIIDMDKKYLLEKSKNVEIFTCKK